MGSVKRLLVQPQLEVGENLTEVSSLIIFSDLKLVSFFKRNAVSFPSCQVFHFSVSDQWKLPAYRNELALPLVIKITPVAKEKIVNRIRHFVWFSGEYLYLRLQRYPRLAPS